MRAVVALVLALFALGAIGLLLFLPARAPLESGGGAPHPDPKSAGGDALVVPGNELVETRPIGGGRTTQDPAEAARIAEAYSLEGEGTIRGHVGGKTGVAFPREWNLILEPHPYLQGRERAESRRVEFRAGERDFRVEHLKLGGYRVRAEALAMNSSSADVLLVQGSPDQFVELLLSPAGWLDGSVVDSEGRPAEGVRVTLVDLATRAEREALTDGAGAWEFRALLDGEYAIRFGAAGRELLPEGSLSFRAPRLSYPAQKLPPTSSLRVEVLDRLGQPAIGARVTGFGRPAGRFDVRSDDRGVARVRWLAPGTWRVSALDEGEGLAAHGELDLVQGEEAVLPLRLVK